jgi:hypothetical protein
VNTQCFQKPRLWNATIIENPERKTRNLQHGDESEQTKGQWDGCLDTEARRRVAGHLERVSGVCWLGDGGVAGGCVGGIDGLSDGSSGSDAWVVRGSVDRGGDAGVDWSGDAGVDWGLNAGVGDVDWSGDARVDWGSVDWFGAGVGDIDWSGDAAVDWGFDARVNWSGDAAVDWARWLWLLVRKCPFVEGGLGYLPPSKRRMSTTPLGRLGKSSKTS